MPSRLSKTIYSIESDRRFCMSDVEGRVDVVDEKGRDEGTLQANSLLGP